MATHHDTSTLKTLADAVTETAAAENATATASSYSAPNASDFSRGGTGVNAAFDGGGSVLVTKRFSHTETRVETRIAGLGGPDSGSGASKGNGVSLGFAGDGAKKCGYPDVEEFGRKNRRGQDKGFEEVNGSVSSEVQMRDNVRGGNSGVENLNLDGSAYTMEMDGVQEDSDDVEYIEDHGYSVGDLVWGKIKSHPWWPGQIYDPSDASESAVKYNQKGRLLVAYFGDGSFAWCSPSQLIPFAQHFEEMSKQSSSKTFVNAVQEAVDEIGRLVEFEMTCQCVPEEDRKGLTRPTAVNAGIKAGVLVPDGDIGKLLSFRYDPAELLATVENAAESVSFSSMLELAILKSWLSAFYRARGGYMLPMYYGPLEIEGLESNDKNETVDGNDFSVPIEVPIHRPLEEDWLSSAASGPGNGQAPPQDKMHHRRKQKSVAELMAEGTGAKPKNRKRSSSIEGRRNNSAIKKQKFGDEVENHSGSVQVTSDRKRVRKKNDDISQSGEPTASDAPVGYQTEVQMQERSFSSKSGEDKVKIPDSNNGEGMKGSEEMSSPRERKKSKYLSPPYAAPGFRAGNLSSKKEELEKETEKITKRARMGERITRAAGKLLESPPLVRCNGKTAKKKLPEGQTEIAADLKPQGGNQDQEKIISIMDASASVNEVLSGLQSFAVNPLYSGKGRLLDLFEWFVLTFRSSMYVNGTNYKEYQKRHPSRKRKSLNSEPAKLVNNLNQTGGRSPVAQTGAKKSMQVKSNIDTPKVKTSSLKSIEKSNTPKLKKAAGGSRKKADSKKVDGKSCPASLVVTFAPGFSLPSRNDIIRIFRKFGDLNERETDVLPGSSSVQICYARSSGAEEALTASLKQNPFGSASVNYKLCYSPAAPVTVESRCQVSLAVEENPDGRPIASQTADNEITDLGSLRDKLQIMTSMLEKCDGKISSEAKSNLAADIKVLFEKVKMIAETASR